MNSCLANVRRNVTKPVYVLQTTLSVRISAPVITATTKRQLMKRMMMRVMTFLMNTVTNLILNTEPFPFFDNDAIFFVHDIWERYFLAFLRISSILDFSNFKAPEMESDKSWKRRNELGYKAFSGPLIHSLSLHSTQISLKTILIRFFKIFCLEFRKNCQKLQENCKKVNILTKTRESHTIYTWKYLCSF